MTTSTELECKAQIPGNQNFEVKVTDIFLIRHYDINDGKSAHNKKNWPGRKDSNS